MYLSKNIVVLAFPSIFISIKALAESIRRTITRGIEIYLEEEFIVCSTKEPVFLASKLKEFYGIKDVVIAKRVDNEFEIMLKTISGIGAKVVLPGEKFFVKVKETENNHEHYASRDVEFACSGELISKLAKINAIPAKNEQEADKVILTTVTKKFAYVYIQTLKGQGGLPFGSAGSGYCAVDGYLSFESCLAAVKAGFIPQMVLFYANENELLENGKFVQSLATRIGLTKHVLRVTPIVIQETQGAMMQLIREAITARVLIALSGDRIIFPYSLAIHPLWFIESAIMQATSARKIPYMPLMFNYDYFESQPSLAKKYAVVNTITKGKFQSYTDGIRGSARSSIKKTKTLKLHIGPNYLHSILDSV